MNETRFDLCFDGTLAEDADPSLARQQLRAAFKLDEQGVARLFSGKPVYIKRDVDVVTAAKFDRIFKQAGAVLHLMPSGASGAEAPGAESGEVSSESTPETAAAAEAPAAAPNPADIESTLSLAPQEGFIEKPAPVKMPDLDTSHLSLVSGPDWTLEDCEPLVATIPVADTSHLSLVDIDPIPDPQRSSD